MKEFTMVDILQEAIKRGASDVHITTGSHPVFRIKGNLIPQTQYPVLTPKDTMNLIFSLLTEENKQKLQENKELDFSVGLAGSGRFRVNAFWQRNSVAAVFRLIPWTIPSFQELGLPPILKDLASLPRGLILVTGPTGSGKSTTLAAMIDYINTNFSKHIITIEDPIEYLHTHKKSIVNQREVGADTRSFANALRSALREDPDVILVGEMRDLETTAIALTAAETGHLVMATLHTVDAVQSIERIVDQFPSHQQQQIRLQLSGVIQGVISQQLLPSRDGGRRVVAVEIMIATPAIRSLIREAKTPQIYNVIQTGGKYGMQTMDQALAELVKKKLISEEVALERAINREELIRLLQGEPRR
ncbi:MAG: type IV pili twitching motility protein PilT [Dictyoglomus sp. NZ13-RE01]|nr:MAG: type IV pili twitching motility protein PilT [Dictyoglomus sp. NZ13-RE01]